MAARKPRLWIAGLTFLTVLRAQTPAPNAYTITQVNSMMGPPIEMTIYRDGSKAVIEQASTSGHRVRTLYDLQTHATYFWDPMEKPATCSSGTFSGAWDDPFAAAASASADLAKMNAKETGAETVNGVATKVFESASSSGKAKVWLDQKSGLIMKMQITPPIGGPKTMLEVKQVSLRAPPASVFVLPAGCAHSRAPKQPDPDFANTIMPADSSLRSTRP